MEFRRARPEDVSAILRLQAANFIGNLAPQDRQYGFLSAEFTPEQIAAMTTDPGVIVASDQGSIVAFLCASRRDFDHQSPVIARMIEQLDRVHFRGRILSSYNAFIYGPVCIDRSQRGRGLLRGLYETLTREVSRRFEVGVAFVARENEHSLQAHIQGLGMVEVGRFQCGGRDYVIVAFSVAPVSSSLAVLGSLME